MCGTINCKVRTAGSAELQPKGSCLRRGSEPPNPHPWGLPGSTAPQLWGAACPDEAGLGSLLLTPTAKQKGQHVCLPHGRSLVEFTPYHKRVPRDAGQQQSQENTARKQSKLDRGPRKRARMAFFGLGTYF